MASEIDFDKMLEVLNSPSEDARHFALLSCQYLAQQLIAWLITAESLDPGIVARQTAAEALDAVAEAMTSRKKP